MRFADKPHLALACRIGSFDLRALAAAKHLVNEVSLLLSDRLSQLSLHSGPLSGWPAAQNRIRTVLERGLQRDADFPKRIGLRTLGALGEPESTGGPR